MRSFHSKVLFAAALALAGGACGGDGNGGTPPENDPPVAAFTFACPPGGLACTFTDASTDPDGAADIDTWDWDFGGDGTSDVQSPSHTFSADGSYEVSLTVTDAAGESNTATQTVTVSVTTPVNNPPTASFTFECLSLDCSFTNGSTDPDAGDVLTWEWDFGDGVGTSTEQSPSYSYTSTAPDTLTVTLIATDADGAADTTSNDVIVAPPAACEGGACDLTLPENATVIVVLDSVGCTADGNTLRITEPVDTTLFTDGCNTTPGEEFELGGAGNVFTANTTIVPQVTSGSQSLSFPPTLRLRAGTAYPTWILEFDDGEGCGEADPTCGGDEPDFDDLIIRIEATAAP
jgi:PKD repeat protein